MTRKKKVNAEEIIQRISRMAIANGDNQEYAIMEVATFCNAMGLSGKKIERMDSHTDKNTQDIVVMYIVKKKARIK